MENECWVNLAGEIQRYADDNDTHKFYNTIKQAYGPVTRCTVPVRSADGATLIKDQEGISQRWAELFSTLLNDGLTPDHSILNEILQRGKT